MSVPDADIRCSAPNIQTNCTVLLVGPLIVGPVLAGKELACRNAFGLRRLFGFLTSESVWRGRPRPQRRQLARSGREEFAEHQLPFLSKCVQRVAGKSLGIGVEELDRTHVTVSRLRQQKQQQCLEEGLSFSVLRVPLDICMYSRFKTHRGLVRKWNVEIQQCVSVSPSLIEESDGGRNRKSERSIWHETVLKN